MSETATTVPPEAHWRAALAEGRFLLQRDPADGTFHFPPRLAAKHGGTLEWVEASGRGTIYSVTEIRRRPPEPSYAVVLVDLAEGPRLMSRVDGIAAEEVAIGMPVRAAIAQENEGPLLVFHQA